MDFSKHIEIPEDKRIIVFGDIHGAYDLLEKAFFDLGVTDDDVKIFVGDLIDRGNQNFKSVMAGMRAPNTYCIRGNHEDMFIKGMLEGDRAQYQCWYHNGGYSVFNELETEEAVTALAVILEEAPVMLTATHGDKLYGFIHAEYPSVALDVPLLELEGVLIEKDYVSRMATQMMWGRDIIDCIKDGIVVPKILGVDAVFHGHTPVKKPFRHENRHYIDSGGVFNGNLSAAIIETGKEVTYYSTKES